METIRWGIIGCGDVTEVKSGPALQKAKGSQLVAVMRRNGNLAKDYAQRHNVAKWYDDAQALINDPDVDAVYIATPPASHKEYTVAAAKAKKPVYVEKPMALNYQECQEMIHCCEVLSVPLFVAYYRRALPRFVKIKTLLENKAIGHIRAINMRLYKPASDADKKGSENWRVNPAVAGGGYFVDLASHMIDLLHFFIGPVVSVKGHTSNQAGLYSAEDVVSATLLFKNDIHACGIWSFNTDLDFEQTEIIGSEGQITYSNFMEAPVVLRRKGKEEVFNIDHPEHIQQPLIQRVVDELLGRGISPTRGTTAARTNWVMDQILAK
jgi:predicted dehydrogenase